jgi:hypothetical protein
MAPYFTQRLHLAIPANAPGPSAKATINIQMATLKKTIAQMDLSSASLEEIRLHRRSQEEIPVYRIPRPKFR